GGRRRRGAEIGDDGGVQVAELVATFRVLAEPAAKPLQVADVGVAKGGARVLAERHDGARPVDEYRAQDGVSLDAAFTQAGDERDRRLVPRGRGGRWPRLGRG